MPIVRLLLDAKADGAAYFADHAEYLCTAVKQNHGEMLGLILDHGRSDLLEGVSDYEPRQGVSFSARTKSKFSSAATAFKTHEEACAENPKYGLFLQLRDPANHRILWFRENKQCLCT